MQTPEDIQQLGLHIAQQHIMIEKLQAELKKVIVGQQYMVERLLIGLLSNGHELLEGVPGLAKTLTIKSLAQAIQYTFILIKFTLFYTPTKGHI
jgi:MoxR-like ATPase